MQGRFRTVRRCAVLFLCSLALLSVSICAYSQTSSAKELMGGGISLRTNALEWLLTVPNFQVGFDLSSSEYNNKSLLLGIKYNWDTWHKLPPYYVFNVLDLRGEYRYHYRYTQQPPGEKFQFWSLARPTPRPWIAHYVGGYVDWSSYSLKPGDTGRQGWQTGFGISAGIELPLYEYGSGAVDIDLGASAGFSLANYNKFGLNESATFYVMKEENPRWAFLPVITELRATFSWRKASVRTKYLKTNPEIPVYKQALKDINTSFATMHKADFDDYQKSIRRLEEIQKVDTTYRGEFVRWVKTVEKETIDNNVMTLPVNDKRKAKLARHVRRLSKAAISEFDSAVREEKADIAKAQREALKQEAIRQKEMISKQNEENQ